MSVPWVEVEPQLQDGNNRAFLCDVIVPSAEVGDWQRVLDLLRERQVEWQVGYAEDGEPAELPSLAHQLAARSTQASVLISINLLGLPIFGHVFAEDWIEFDVPARDINGQDAVDTLVGFVRALGQALGREVRATPEATHDSPMFAYDPLTDEVHTP